MKASSIWDELLKQSLTKSLSRLHNSRFDVCGEGGTRRESVGKKVRGARAPGLVCPDIDPQPPGYMAAVYQFVSSPLFSAALEGNKQARFPTPDHTLLSNSTLARGKVVVEAVEGGDWSEIQQEGIKAIISLR